MKEYFIVPIKDYVDLKSTCIGNTQQSSDKKDILTQESLPPELKLDILRSIDNFKQREPVTKKEPPPTKKEKKEFNFDDFVNFIPLNLQQGAREILHHVLETDGVALNPNGVVYFDKSSRQIRVEDLLGSILIKNAPTKHIKDILLLVVKSIPDKLIVNKRVLKLKDPLNDTGGGLQHIIWHHYIL